MKASTTWTLAITGLLAANVVAMAILAVVAHSGTHQVIPDYYTKATHYDDEMARSSVSQALGWRVEIAIAGTAIGASVSDAAGEPLDGARVHVSGYQRAHAAERVDLALAPDGPGHYRAVLGARRGWYDLVAVVEARGAHYTRHIVVEAR